MYTMKRLSIFLLTTLVLSSLNAQVKYPKTKSIEQKDDYFGTTIQDPYRWLEDDMSEDTKKWVEQQNEVTFKYLDNISYRPRLKEKLTELWNYEKVSAPTKHGYFYYYSKNNGLQKQSVVYRRNHATWKEELFIDPNLFSKDGTVSLSSMDFSKDGSMLAISLSDGGSDWRKVLLMHVHTKNIVDTIHNVKFGNIAWRGDDTVFYSTYDKDTAKSILSTKNQNHKLMRHIIGKNQSEDILVFGGEENPYRYISGYFTNNENILIISAASNTKKNDLFIKDAVVNEQKALKLTDGITASSSVIDEHDGELYIVTDYNAPNKKLVKTRLSNPHFKEWTTVIAEQKFPCSYSLGGNYIWMQSVEDVKNKINKYDRYGVFQETIKLPGIGAIGNWGCEKEDSLIYYTFTNSLSPSAIHKYDITTNTSELYYTSKINFNANDFVTKQIFYTSKDGTKIPMTITHKSDINLNGKNPTILYGYGGFNVNLMPSFSAAVLFWLKMGGVYAVANLRGGGEYGNKWHEQGIKMKKQNVFDDFFAAAQYLNDLKYANAEHLAISGGSNGGLLVGATMTQHPELCKVALPAVGVLDMLRYHKFTAGAGWAYDYGTSEDSKDMFDYLKSYSPVHNVSKKCYPATMVTTGDHDDRVIPAHSFKFAAKLQADQNCDNPILIRIDVRAGHGAGKSTEQVINETIDKYVFTLHNMGVKSIDENLKLKF